MQNNYMSSNFRLFLHIVLFVLVTFLSCKRANLDGFSKKPAYIKVDDISVLSIEKKHGANTDQITDAWLFVDDNQIGVFELPCEIPVLLEGDRNIKIFAGIKKGGIASQRAKYEFYEAYEIDTVLVPEKTIEISPTVSYNSDLDIEWIEDFEDISILVDSATNSKTGIKRINTPSIVRSGLYCGYIELTPEYNNTIIYTVDEIQVEKFVPSYLEFDYKTNVTLLVSMQSLLRSGVRLSSDIISIKATNNNEKEGWKKMYVYISPGVNTLYDSYKFQFFFKASLPENATNGYIYLDNIKVVY